MCDVYNTLSKKKFRKVLWLFRMFRTKLDTFANNKKKEKGKTKKGKLMKV